MGGRTAKKNVHENVFQEIDTGKFSSFDCKFDQHNHKRIYLSRINT